MIFAGIILLFLTKWVLGAVFFVGGWTFLLVGHRIEGNHPAFLQGPVYLLVGPVWVAKEIWDFINRGHRARLANPVSDSASDTRSAAAQTKQT